MSNKQEKQDTYAICAGHVFCLLNSNVNLSTCCSFFMTVSCAVVVVGYGSGDGGRVLLLMLLLLFFVLLLLFVTRHPKMSCLVP